MTQSDRSERYTRGAIGFHWVIAALVIVNLTIGLLHDSLLAGFRGAIPMHKSIGMTVLLLSIGRIAWRLTHRPPPLPVDVAAWVKGASHAVHALLYLLIIAMPLTGWMMISGSKRHPFSWFGLFDLPYLPVSDAASDAGFKTHAVLGWLMLGLVVLHVAAALRHHWILRDRVLARMAPALDRN